MELGEEQSPASLVNSITFLCFALVIAVTDPKY